MRTDDANACIRFLADHDVESVSIDYENELVAVTFKGTVLYSELKDSAYESFVNCFNAWAKNQLTRQMVW